MRGRYLIGLGAADRRAAGVTIGDHVDVEAQVVAAPRAVGEPGDFARAATRAAPSAPPE